MAYRAARLSDVPNAAAINRNIGFAVAVVVSRGERIGCQAPIYDLHIAVGAAADIPIPFGRAEHRDIGFTVAVVTPPLSSVRATTILPSA